MGGTPPSVRQFSSATDRLDSWKEIAAYLNRGIRTVQRWERTHALPVHRIPHDSRGSVFAFKPELDAWWKGHGAVLEADGTSPAAVSGPKERISKRSLLRIAAILALLGMAGAGLWFWGRWSKPTESSLTAIPLTTYPGRELNPSFSPDGNQIAFAWDGEKQDNLDIYVKLIGTEKPRRLTSHPAADLIPAWSPDGRSIAFLRMLGEERLEVLLAPAIGGPERKLGETHAPYNPSYTALDWSPDGRWLVVSDRLSRDHPVALFLLSTESGEMRRLTSPPARSLGDRAAAFSPDGRALVFVRRDVGGDLYLLPLSRDLVPEGEPRRLTKFSTRAVTHPAWTPDGREVIFSLGAREAPVSLWRTAVSGSGAPRPLMGLGDGCFEPTVSRRGGRLVYSRQMVEVGTWRIGLSKNGGKAGEPVRVISSTRSDLNPQYSPDGRRIAFHSMRSGASEIWVCDSDGSNPMQLTSLGAPVTGGPRWSPDGQHIVFDSNLEGQAEVYVVPATGGKPQRLTTHPAVDGAASYSRDGRWIYFMSNRSGEPQVWKLPAQGGPAIQVTKRGGFVAFGSFDGKFVYYSKRIGLSALCRVPVNGGEEEQVLETVTGLTFAVVEDGVYFTQGSSIQFFSFRTGGVRTVMTTAKPPSYGLAVSPDRRWLLYTQHDQETSDLMLVENFR